MKIYILRHEERYESPKFYTQLTPSGLDKSKLLTTILDNESINLIFSSPFIRVLQTIKPYCEYKNMHKSICIDYSLYESMYDSRFFKKHEYPIDLSSNDELFYLKDIDYKSTIPIANIKCPENKTDVQNRIIQFVTKLIEKYEHTTLNILLASHAAILTPLIKNMNTEYPLGGLTKIYENGEYLCQAINY